MPKNIKNVIISKLDFLKIDPYSQNNNVKKLEGLECYRIRIGDGRVIYEIENYAYKILVIAIAVRGDIYK